MRRLSFFVGFLGLLACSDASSKAEVTPKETPKEAPKAAPVAKIVVSPIMAANWTVDKAKSTLSFSGNQSGADFTGVFGDFDAVINFDPADLANAKVVVTIDMNSADAGEAERTNALPGKEWFNVKKFPAAKFVASNFRYLAKSENGDNYEATGNLTIRDITQEIVLPFTLKIESGHAAVDAKLIMDRTAYKIGTGMWASKDWVGHDIVVNIHLDADKK